MKKPCNLVKNLPGFSGKYDKIRKIGTISEAPGEAEK